MMPKSIKHRSKKHRFLMILRSIFVLFGVWRLPGPPLDRLGVPLGATVVPRGAPGAPSGVPGPPFGSPRASILVSFSMEKTVKKLMIFLVHFFIDFVIVLGAQMPPKTSQKSLKNQLKICLKISSIF